MEIYTYSVIIPAYNERERITTTLDRVLAYLAEKQWHAEIVVVNDGSRDDTAEIVRQYAEKHRSVRLIENPGNRGKGYSVRNGVLHALGNVLLFSDADLSSPIYEAPKLFAEIDKGADIAIGSRWVNSALQTERQSVLRQVLGRMYNILLRLVLGLRYRDTQCGFKAFTKEAALAVFSRQKIERWGFDPEILYLARKFDFKVSEVPVEWAHDNRSKINPLADGIKMFVEMLRVRWNDITGRYEQAKRSVAMS